MTIDGRVAIVRVLGWVGYVLFFAFGLLTLCLLYTSDAADE